MKSKFLLILMLRFYFKFRSVEINNYTILPFYSRVLLELLLLQLIGVGFSGSSAPGLLTEDRIDRVHIFRSFA